MSANSSNATPASAMPAGELFIRPATPADAPAGAALIHLAMGRLADFLFGGDDPAQTEGVLARLFALPDNRFSHQFVAIAQAGTEPAGLLLAHPGTLLRRLERTMPRQLLRVLGADGMVRFLPRALPLMGLREAERDEFYIFTLAVAPAFQGRGVGRRLLAHAEASARAACFRKLSLGVETDNARAVRLYHRAGFQTAATVRVPHLERHIGYAGYHRMVKCLN